MAEDKDFQKRIQRIGSLVGELDSVVDPAARAAAKHLLQLLMELHGAGFERMLELTFQAGDPGADLIDQFGRDSLVSSLLVLYGLHPDDMETRIGRAVEGVKLSLRKQGADVQVVAMDSSEIRLRLSTDGHACGSTTATLKTMVEDAVYEAAPDASAVIVEGPADRGVSAFVSIDKLIGSSIPVTVSPHAAHATEGAD